MIKKSVTENEHGFSASVLIEVPALIWESLILLKRSKLSPQFSPIIVIKADWCNSYIIRNVSSWYRSLSAIPADASLAAYVVSVYPFAIRGITLMTVRTCNESCPDVLTFCTLGQIPHLGCKWIAITCSSSGQSRLSYLPGNAIGRRTDRKRTVSFASSYTEYILNPQLLSDEPATTSAYKGLIGRFYFNYAMLIINSFGLQNALERSSVDIGHFFARCHTSAMACAKLVRDELGPSGFMKYSPDSHFVQTSYAVLSLLKVRHYAMSVCKSVISDNTLLSACPTRIPCFPR